MRERFLLLLVMSTVGMPCLTQLDVLHHSALLSVYCVHVLVIRHRFYVLNVIFKCYLYFVYSGYRKCLLKMAWQPIIILYLYVLCFNSYLNDK